MKYDSIALLEESLKQEGVHCIDKNITRDWPLLLRPMKLLAQPSDTGLGDIVERTIGPVGGDAYKLWYKATFGKPCGCTKRKDNLNERYPL